MKHLAYIFILLGTCLLMSCSKEDFVTNSFIGTYSISVIQNVVWGNDSGTINDNGTLHITMISNNKVQLKGYITTQGVIRGKALYLEGNKVSDKEGNITTSYGVATLDGNILTFTAYQTGELSGYSYRNTSYFTAIKQN